MKDLYNAIDTLTYQLVIVFIVWLVRMNRLLTVIYCHICNYVRSDSALLEEATVT